MANMFEKTMNACLESRRVETKNQKTLKEADELIDQELGLFDDDVDEIINDDLPTDPDLTPDVEMGDFADDVVVVIDPEVAPDTEPEDMPPVEEYVGDLTYRCPICGNSFFSEAEMKEGDECPVCAEIPGDGFELVGEIAEAEDVKEDEDKSEDKAEDEKKDETPAEPDIEEELEIDETEKEESVVRRPNRPTRRPIRTAENRRPVPRRPRVENRRPAPKPIPRRPVAEQKRIPARRPIMKMEDISFSKCLTRFVRENYKNARSLRLVGATKGKNGLVLECRLVMKSGKTRNIKFACEGYRPQGNFILRATDNGILKRESKTAPISFKCSVRNGAIVCEGMKYDYITRISENKKAHVKGQYMNEAARPVRNRRPAPRRAVESRNVARRPMPRRAVESRRPAHRPMPRRATESVNRRTAPRRPVHRAR